MIYKVLEKLEYGFKLIPVRIDNELPKVTLLEVSQWVFDNPSRVEQGDIVQVDRSLLFARILKKGVK